MKKINQARLNWKQYSWEEFEKICCAYLKATYSSEFYKVKLTRARKDGGKDIIIKGRNTNFEAWAECKNHTRNIDLSVIGKNVVLALSHKINQAIFFSVSAITLNTKVEILTVAQIHGFEVLFLDGNILDDVIMKCPQIVKKYFKKDYTICDLQKGNLVIQTIISEYEFAEEAHDFELQQYHLENGFEVYLHIFIKNVSQESLKHLSLTLLIEDSNQSLVFYEHQKEFDELNFHSECYYTFHGLILSAECSIAIPKLCIDYVFNGETYQVIKECGTIDSSDVWRAPLIGTDVNQFLGTAFEHICKVVEKKFTRIIYLEGIAGTGKSRLLDEMHNKCLEKGYSSLIFDFREKDEDEIFKNILTKLLYIPNTKYMMNISYSEFQDMFHNLPFNNDEIQVMYNFLFNCLEEDIFYGLSRLILKLIINSKFPLFIGFDNIQSTSNKAQIILWNIASSLKKLNTETLLAFTLNTDRIINNHNVIIEYLNDTCKHNKENYIFKYKCKELSLADGEDFVQQLLNLSFSDKPLLKAIVSSVGTRPLDLLLVTKSISQIGDILVSTSQGNHIGNLSKLQNLLSQGNVVSDEIVLQRINTFLQISQEQKVFNNIISVLTYLDGKLAITLYEALGFSKQNLLKLSSALLIKADYSQDKIMFYHGALLQCCQHEYNCPDKEYIRCLIELYNDDSTKKMHIPDYAFLKALIYMGENETAKIKGMEILKTYKDKNDFEGIDKVTEQLLNIIDSQKETSIYFDVLIARALVLSQQIDFTKSEKLYEDAFKMVSKYSTLLGKERVSKFYHQYCNDKLHHMKYREAVDVLKKLERMQNMDQYMNLVIQDRLCVAYFSLGDLDNALYHINICIDQATLIKDYHWISTAYSDKAYALYVNTNDKEGVCNAFDQVLYYYEKSKCVELYRAIEINIQTALRNILLEDILEANAAIEKAISIAENTVYTYLLVPALNLKAFLLIVEENFTAAKEILGESLSYANAFLMDKALIAIYLNLGIITLLEMPACPNKALCDLEVAYQTLKKLCDSDSSHRFYNLLSSLLKIYVAYGFEENAKALLCCYPDTKLNDYYQKCKDAIEKNIEIESFSFGLLSYKGYDFLY